MFHSLQFAVYLASSCLPVLTHRQLDATILAPALPVSATCLAIRLRTPCTDCRWKTLAVALNGDAVATFWTGTSYLLSYAVFLPFIGVSSSIFGRKAAVLFSLGMFTLGTILCCTADGFPQMLSGRTVQGIGGGGIFVLGSIVIADIVRVLRPEFLQPCACMAAHAWCVCAIADSSPPAPSVSSCYRRDLGSWRNSRPIDR